MLIDAGVCVCVCVRACVCVTLCIIIYVWARMRYVHAIKHVCVE